MLARIDDTYGDKRFERSADVNTGFVTRNLLAVPVLKQGGDAGGKERRVVGCVLEALNQSGGRFEERHVELLDTIAVQVGSKLLGELILDEMLKDSLTTADDSGMEADEVRFDRTVWEVE